MSNEVLRAAIEQMEAWVADPNWEPDPETLIQWNKEFLAAKVEAKKTEVWPELVERAHALGACVEVRTAQLGKRQDEIKAELDAQGRGNRALQGYGASAR